MARSAVRVINGQINVDIGSNQEFELAISNSRGTLSIVGPKGETKVCIPMNVSGTLRTQINHALAADQIIEWK